MSIIRRKNCIYRRLVLCLICRREWKLHSTLHISHPYRSIKHRINTVVSPDDGHIVARNMQRKEIYILRKIVHKVGLIYKVTENIQLCECYGRTHRWAVDELNKNRPQRSVKYLYTRRIKMKNFRLNGNVQKKCLDNLISISNEAHKACDSSEK